MTDIGKANAQIFRNGVFRGIITATEQLDGSLRIVYAIKRFYGRVAPALCLAAFPFCLHLLNVCGIAQHDGAKVGGDRRGVDPALEAVSVESRQHTGVIDMSVGEKDGVDQGCRNRQRDILIEIPPLLHAAVDEIMAAAELQQRTAAGHLVGGADEGQLHKESPLLRLL